MNECLYNALLFLLALGFLAGIKLMSSPGTSVRGNMIGSLSMFLAVVVTLYGKGIAPHGVILSSMAVGGIIGWLMGAKAAMIRMPQLVALLNGFGGGASAMTAFVVLGGAPESDLAASFTGGLALIVGGVTFGGSMIAAAKLDRRMNQRPIFLAGHTALSTALLLLSVVLVGVIGAPLSFPADILSILALACALLFGIVFTVRIGGADMPVAISLLNSLSGLAGSIAGLAIKNPLLVAVGAIVGAAGLILTRIMCRAMNRSLAEVVLGRTTAGGGHRAASIETAASGAGDATAPETGADRPDPYDEALDALRNARSVVIVPGYGMAVSQAQDRVRALYEKLEEAGKEVRFAIHPVAGRMPGHMNVLLAEVDIPYDILHEMDDINPDLPDTDVVVVVGANDVVNPTASTSEETPLSGMPILTVHEAARVVVCNIDTKPGYAGVDNPLYGMEHVTLVIGDAKETVGALTERLTAGEQPADHGNQ